MRARRLPVGAELVSGPEAGVHFRVWAPAARRVVVVIEAPDPREVVLAAEPGGYFAGHAPGLGAGARYRYRLDDGAPLADPASRFQPEGPFGPSEVIDPAGFAWTDAAWRGIAPHRHVLYEMHVGTFTPEGTWAAAAEALPFLAEVGITTLEVMPIADFDGRHNWGYDGVCLYAPSRNHGRPDDLRRFVDRAHALGIAVILDVVYNHIGPAGSTLLAFAPGYRAHRDDAEWGDPFDFDGPDAAPVRELMIANAGYWIDEFHLDGLRLDATQAIHDRSPEHIIAAIVRRARAAGAGRQIFVVAENEPQDRRQIDEYGLDAMWNDDFHHSARVALTGHIDGYFHDYQGTPSELLAAVQRGFLYQGQLYPWQEQPRGTPTRGLAPAQMVHFLENHDQAANSGFGERLIALTTPGRWRAMTALLLLSPPLPMLFQGQEHGSRHPWRFFVDHGPDLAPSVRDGRAAFLRQFVSLATDAAQAALPDPSRPETFTACVLDPAARRLDDPWVMLHRDLLQLRRDDPAFTDQGPGAVQGAVLDAECFALRFGNGAHPDRLLVVNLGRTVRRGSFAESLLAPPRGTGWKLAWTSEHPRYGGRGTPVPFTSTETTFPAHAAILCVPDPESRLAPARRSER